MIVKPVLFELQLQIFNINKRKNDDFQNDSFCRSISKIAYQ
jgi:hypothetical protein